MQRAAGGILAQPQVAMVAAYEADDRQAIALLLLPFLILALFLGLSHTLKPVGQLMEAARERASEGVSVATPRSMPGTITLPSVVLPVAVPGALKTQERVVLTSPPTLPGRPPHIPLPPVVVVPEVPTPHIALPATAPLIPLPTVAAGAVVVPTPALALPGVAPAVPAPPPIVIATPAIELPGIAPRITAAAPEVCLPAPQRAALVTPPPPSEFGARLAAAAQAQTADFVIYNASYKRIKYPMGDVPSMYGACSDLVIRAYRALGIDLQELVQRSRLGRGDPNIDHRRTETLRSFFAKHGQSIAPSQFPEDYQPGDIVTYYRPYSRVSRAHIAIVTDLIGPSGHPMIVHNRGWGPQIEDALFVDRITGQYRFTGSPHYLASSERVVAQPPAVAASKVGRQVANGRSAAASASSDDASRIR